MHARVLALGGILILAAAAASAQNKVTPTYDDVYCSGTIDGESVPSGTQLISGVESNTDPVFQENDYVYVNKGSDQGVKVGDEFQVVRPVDEATKYPWFKWQFPIMKKIGQIWEDEGRLRVIVTQPKTSIAQIVNSCAYMQRGDIVLPATKRVVPPLRTGVKFDQFAPASGKALAMVIVGKNFSVSAGTNDIVYVNLGANQGVKVGDYFRMFRYTGQETEIAFQDRGYAFKVLGFGGASPEYKWNNTPRQVVGEGIVMRATPNASTVLITFSLREIFSGDYVEIE